MKRIVLVLLLLTPNAFASDAPVHCEYASWKDAIVNIHGYGSSEYESRNDLYRSCMARFQRTAYCLWVRQVAECGGQ
ncbi:hypothetical protein EB061_10530 [bacterium]|nr:hypothetical protein [bacterium]